MTGPVRLVANRSGQGPLILLLHGIGGSRVAWDWLVARLEGSFTCLVPDLPGYGNSPDPASPGLPPIVDAIAALLGDEPAHVIGVSFGGLCTLSLARRYPRLVRTLTLADATLGRAAGPADIRDRWLRMRYDLAPRLFDSSQERAAEIAAPGAPGHVLDEIARAMRRVRPIGYTAVADAIAATDARSWLKDILQPALVLCGDQDTVTGAEMSQVLAKGLSDARYMSVTDSGHAPHIEQPEQMAAALRQFLASATAHQGEL